MRATRLKCVAAFAGLLGLASMPAPPPPQPPQDPDGFVLEAGEHDIRALIDRSAKFLGRNYIYSDADMANAPGSTVRLQNRLALDAVGCEEVVGQLAYALGFAMIPIDEKRGLYQWVFRQGPLRAELAARASWMPADDVLRHRGRQIQVLTHVPLEYIDATAAQNTLRPFFLAGGGSGGSTLVFGAAGDSLMMQGLASQVAAAIALIREVDKAPRAAPEDGWREQLEARVTALEKGREARAGK